VSGVEEESDKDAVSRLFSSTYTTRTPLKKTLEKFGNFKIGGKVICTLKYADGHVLLPEEEVVLQGMFERLFEVVTYYGMEINVEKTKVMRNSRPQI